MPLKVNKIADLKISSPAHRALADAGISSLKKLSKLSEAEVLALHGIGKTAIPVLKSALKLAGLSFAGKTK